MLSGLKRKLSVLDFNYGNSPIYFISQIFGQIPYSVSIIKNIHRIRLSFNMFALAYSIICFALYAFSLYTFISESYKSLYDFPAISRIGHFAHIIIGLLNSLICYAFVYIKASRLVLFINKLHDIDDELNGVCDKIQIDYSKSFKFQLKYSIFFFLIFLFIGAYDYYIYHSLGDKVGFNIFVAYMVPYLFSSCSLGQFIFLVQLLHDRFKLVNKFLNNIVNTNEPTSEAVKLHRAMFDLDECKTDNKSEDKMGIFSITQNFLIQRKQQQQTNMNTTQNQFGGETRRKSLDDIDVDLISYTTSSTTNCVENFKSSVKSSDVVENRKDSIQTKIKGNIQSFTDYFRAIFGCSRFQKSNKKIESEYPMNLHLRMNDIFSMHDKLSDIAEDLNDLYSAEMVVYITGAFVLILFGIFYETKVVFWPQGINYPLMMLSTSYVFWSFLVTIVIYVALMVCSNARDESWESALIIHKILQNKPMFMLNDEIFYGKMKSFTLQILHRKKVFCFHGVGLFKLDYTFIFSAVSAATSYLIVLLQFDMTTVFQTYLNERTE